MRFYRALARFDRGRPAATLLFKVAANLWRDRHRRAPTPTVAADTDAAPSEQQVEAAAVQRLERQAIAGAVKRLRRDYRMVVSLRFDQGLSCAEIAEALKISPGTVASWLHRALDALRDALKDGSEEGGVP